ncbi:hypothetical protein D9M71_334320 [compost metagenome]
MGAWPNSAVMATATAPATTVPTTWAKLFCSAMPASGVLTMITVMVAHFGCSRSRRKAMYSVSSPAAMVRRANSRVSRFGCRSARK